MRESLIERIISSLYGDERGTGLFLDLAAYYLTTENNAGQYYPDYAYNHPLFTPEAGRQSGKKKTEYEGAGACKGNARLSEVAAS